MVRIKFEKGEQRKFLDLCCEKLDSPSVVGLLQFGVDCSASALKNYYVERRLLSENVFLELCHLAKIDNESIVVERFGENWGKTKGGRSKKILKSNI